MEIQKTDLEKYYFSLLRRLIDSFVTFNLKE